MQLISTTRARRAPIYPNAADRRYYFARFTDLLLRVAIGISAVTIVFFLITML